LVSSKPLDHIPYHTLGSVELYGMGLIFVGHDFQFILTAPLQHPPDTLVIDKRVTTGKKELDRELKT